MLIGALGDWLSAGSTLLVAVIGLLVGYAVRRDRTTATAIENVRRATDENVTGLRSDVSALRSDVSTIRADLAGIKGYLAAVQGDHYAFRTPLRPEPPDSERRGP